MRSSLSNLAAARRFVVQLLTEERVRPRSPKGTTSWGVNLGAVGPDSPKKALLVLRGVGADDGGGRGVGVDDGGGSSPLAIMMTTE